MMTIMMKLHDTYFWVNLHFHNFNFLHMYIAEKCPDQIFKGLQQQPGL